MQENIRLIFLFRLKQIFVRFRPVSALLIILLYAVKVFFCIDKFVKRRQNFEVKHGQIHRQILTFCRPASQQLTNLMHKMFVLQ